MFGYSGSGHYPDLQSPTGPGPQLPSIPSLFSHLHSHGSPGPGQYFQQYIKYFCRIKKYSFRRSGSRDPRHGPLLRLPPRQHRHLPRLVPDPAQAAQEEAPVAQDGAGRDPLQAQVPGGHHHLPVGVPAQTASSEIGYSGDYFQY